MFEQLLTRCNDVGLLAEQFDPHRGQLTGNFPQALSHLALVNTALLLSQTAGEGGRPGRPARLSAPASRSPGRAIRLQCKRRGHSCDGLYRTTWR